MRRFLFATVAAIGLALPAAAQETRFEARLAGHALLPAATFTPPPEGAPPGFDISGRFNGAENARIAQPESVMGNTGAAYGNRDTGIRLPFRGQPVQGFSGIKPAGNGAYWVLTDNGFGARANSPDAMLMFHRIRPDFATGQVTVEQTIFLSDPNSVVPFRITTEGSRERFLTGADFDPESIQPLADGTFYIGEEFGPFLIHVDAQGRVLRVVETRLDGQPIRSPDHPAFSVPASPTTGVAFRARRSGGYEGMAMTPNGQRLWGLLEQPLFAAGTDRSEGNFLRLIEFDVARGEWTGRNLRFQLAEGATAIGDFNFIDDNRALIIERDNGQGDPGLECREGQRPPACFVMPARVKRVTLVDFSQVDADGFVRKIGYIDLMAMQDPDNRARLRGDLPQGAPAGRFTFPFFTIENVAMVDADHIIVGNDNNLPFSAGRHLTRADDNELILLRVPELLRAR
ncbi:esterase-like activity of phytase family protein [Roseococcus sp. YIM B11640]|uniref:esterase-like activity of phytase family protein n=1 Tax=Roseococcus sp. YIM B11640 TaxID=3133973 RepID=UPI003C7A8788